MNLVVKYIGHVTPANSTGTKIAAGNYCWAFREKQCRYGSIGKKLLGCEKLPIASFEKKRIKEKQCFKNWPK